MFRVGVGVSQLCTNESWCFCSKGKGTYTFVCLLVSVCTRVRVCGWKTYDMWQLVGRCHRGGREKRGDLLLPWRPHSVAHGRVPWSRSKLRERQLNNRIRGKNNRKKKLIHIYRMAQWAEASDEVAIPRSWHQHNANLQPTQKRDEIRSLFLCKRDRSSFGCHTYFYTSPDFSFWAFHNWGFLLESLLQSQHQK